MQTTAARKQVLSHWMQWLVVLATIAGFMLVKMSALTLRYGDGNTYLYMAERWLDGVQPYQDFFFADFPVLLYVLLAFIKVFGTWVWGYYALPIVLESCTAGVIFIIGKKLRLRFAPVLPLIYLLSFSTLATVDYPTGLQLVIFFLSVGWLSLINKKYFFAGALFALAALTKMYAAPGLIGLGAFLFYKRQWSAMVRLMLAGALATAVVLLPILNIYIPDGFAATFFHHFHRPDGIEKAVLFSFYLQKEWLLVLLAAVGIAATWKRLAIGWMIGGWVLFFLIFRDMYYLYLHVMSWALILLAFIGLEQIVQRIQQRIRDANARLLAIMTVSLTSFIWLLFGMRAYEAQVYPDGLWLNAHEIVAFLNTQAPDTVLYGSHEITPYLAQQTGMNILENVIDSNAQTFGSGVHDRRALSLALVQEQGILIAKVSRYPDIGVLDQGFERYFDRDIFEQYCSELRSFPTTSVGQSNLVVLYTCTQ